MFCKSRIFNNTLYVRYVHLKKPSIFISEKPERMLQKDNGRKDSVAPGHWSVVEGSVGL
jgi:hypothetical protein